MSHPSPKDALFSSLFLFSISVWLRLSFFFKPLSNYGHTNAPFGVSKSQKPPPSTHCLRGLLNPLTKLLRYLTYAGTREKVSLLLLIFFPSHAILTCCKERKYYTIFPYPDRKLANLDVLGSGLKSLPWELVRTW